MDNNTGLMLFDARGPLTTLLTNLSGEHGNYWLTALKKMLRKEDIPEPPTEVLALLMALNSRETAQAKVEEWVACLNLLPVVHTACQVLDDDDSSILDVCVHPDLSSFIQNNKDSKKDTVLFMVKNDASVCLVTDKVYLERITDRTFQKWYKERYSDLHAFSQALMELGKSYATAIAPVNR